MKVDFRKIRVADIEGNPQEADVSKDLGNLLYMQGQNIEECELGRELWLKGDVELSGKQADSVCRFAQRYPYVLRSAIEAAVKSDK